MKCNKCGNEMNLKLGAKLISKGCKILTAMTTIVTVQCDQCNALFQIPITGNSFITVKQEKEKKE
ncbi:MAG: hypothetical protein WC781_02560 [Candidatus Pacearchaeota archaeon]|jgi:hypothetical protein